jgi:hypothetical protein
VTGPLSLLLFFTSFYRLQLFIFEYGETQYPSSLRESQKAKYIGRRAPSPCPQTGLCNRWRTPSHRVACEQGGRCVSLALPPHPYRFLGSRAPAPVCKFGRRRQCLHRCMHGNPAAAAAAATKTCILTAKVKPPLCRTVLCQREVPIIAASEDGFLRAQLFSNRRFPLFYVWRVRKCEKA